MQAVKLFIGTEKGIFTITSDRGREKWTVQGPLLKGWRVLDIQPDFRNGKMLYAAVGHYVYGACIQISRDGGETWHQVEKGPAFAKDSPYKMNNIWTITPGADSEPRVVYAGCDEASIFVSRNNGLQWKELTGLAAHPTRGEWVGGLGGLCCHSILVHPQNPKRIWVGISAVGVFRSDDGGESWELKNEGLEIVVPSKTHKGIGSCVHCLVLDKRNPDRLFQQNHRGVFRSYDGGDSWQRIENGIPNSFGFPMVVSKRNPDILFIIPQESDEFRFTRDGHLAVYRSKDSGDNWQEVKNGLPKDSFVGVLRKGMDIDDQKETGIYFGTSGGLVFYSRNNGDSWQQIPVALPRIASVTAMAVNQRTD